LEFNYVKAPLKYRMTPFSEKSKSYSFEDDVLENEEFEIVPSKNTESNNFDSIFQKAESIIQDLKTDYKNKIDVVLQMIIDKLTDKNKVNLIKKLIIDYIDTKGKMSHPYQQKLFEYFSPIYLYKNRDELGRGYTDDDKIIGFYYIYPVGEKNEGKRVKIYCLDKETGLITDCDAKKAESIRLNIRVRLSKMVKNSFKNQNIIRGFMEWKEGPYVFKIFDGTRDTGAQTKEMRKSKRSEVKGKECSYHNMFELEEVSKKLGVKLNDKQKRNICIMIEYQLRENDMTKKDGKRWFKNCVEELLEKISLLKSEKK
jgi:hypothetical protein